MNGIHILHTPMEEVSQRPDGGERWCFVCRRRRTFELVVTAPVELSYYGPTAAIRCSSCNVVDGDLFPGRQREWEN